MPNPGRIAAPHPADGADLRRHVAVAFTTILRPGCSERLIRSVLKHQPGLPVHCGLQGELPSLVDAFASHPEVHFHSLPFDAGLSRARNELFRHIDASAILIVDDDMALTADTDLATAFAALQAHPEIGIVGGRYLREFQRSHPEAPFVPNEPPRFEFFIERPQRGLLRLRRIAERYGEAYERDVDALYLADVVHNVALIRRDLVARGPLCWDEDMKVGGEHLDFYLTLQARKPCRVAFHGGLAVEHYRETGGGYQAFRGRALGLVALLRKWNLYGREIIGEEIRDFRHPEPPRRALGERLGLGRRSQPLRRIRGPRGAHLARPHRAVAQLAAVTLEERYRRLFVQSRVDPFLQNVFVARDRRWLFVQSSKCACTFVKRALEDVECGPRDYEHEMDVHTMHELDSGIKLDAREVVRLLRSRSVFRFAFVRNPFLRALSAYLDKFCDSSRPPFLAAVATESYIRHHRSSPGPAPVSFREFLEYIASQDPTRMDRHWRPLTDALLLPRIRYDQLGRVERLGEDFGRVLERIGARKHAARAAGPPTNVTHAGDQIATHYDGPCVDLVRRIYRRDFEAFGYSLDPEATESGGGAD